ncbi:MAG TPA: LysR substrate-binding domain-containing protein, partial [Dongiaceae bacterium]|nr:LysR substrate-binding domain-containing protein [Dongiaceae bacterium]
MTAGSLPVSTKPITSPEQGCLYRNRLIHAIEAAARTWHIAYTSPNLPGIQAAVSVGLGVSILPDVA